VPITGPLLQKVIMARFATVFALLYRSGITILDALRTSEAIVGNRVIGEAIARATGRITAGASLTDAFRDLGTFPPLVIRMLRVGEATGALDTALANVTYFYDRDVRESIERGMKLLEPALILVLGASLLLIMWAVLSPVYDILGKLDL
jgi:type IV pilus assembly protein PilC